MKYPNQVEKPREPKEGNPGDMHAAHGLKAYSGNMPPIAYGRGGYAGCEDAKRKIAPYMVYDRDTQGVV